jgi:hypothetical protein
MPRGPRARHARLDAVLAALVGVLGAAAMAGPPAGAAEQAGPRPTGNVAVSIPALPAGYRAGCTPRPDGECWLPGAPCPRALHGDEAPGVRGPVVCAHEGGWRWVPDARGRRGAHT